MTNVRRVSQAIEDIMVKYGGVVEFSTPTEANAVVGSWTRVGQLPVSFGVNPRALLEMTEKQIAQEVESTILANAHKIGPLPVPMER